MITEHGIFYTIEELSELTGLAENTIYNWTTYGIIPYPSRGILKGRPSKGLYSEAAVERVQLALKLKSIGKTIKDIVSEFDKKFSKAA